MRPTFITSTISSLKILIENHVTSTDASFLWQTVSHTLLTTIRNNPDFLCIAFDGTICLASLAKVVLTVSDHDEWLICRAFRSKPFILFLMLTTLSAWIDSHVSIIGQIIRKTRNASRQIWSCVTARTRIALSARIGAKKWHVRWSNEYWCCAHSDRVRCIP